ncbi:hypothetical protein PVK06_029054 [Gossypium arboreum]|uniref:F-box domain-containing protein n=1 Tax=Gossypium arboreum TaxID=29729 RepID=A0ABR0P5L8_GOSAR|nr:hypothetical protein PVK06_029054 [Gossypium arboreum]
MRNPYQRPKSKAWISSLPEDILSHILSFVELREAVKTLVLSKRWKRVWTWIHCIYLNNKPYLRFFNRDLLSMKEENKRRPSFINFVNEILTGNNDRILSLTSFSLWYYFGSREDTVYEEIPSLVQWIIAAAAAVTSILKNFDFGIGVGGINMPPILFQCQNLVTLTVISFYSNMICVDVPETVCLSSPIFIMYTSSMKTH